jgi:hypothetical protein
MTTSEQEEMQRMRAALEDLALHGIHADTSPTMVGSNRPVSWWYDYLEHADKTVRAIAKRGLGR